MAKLCLCFGELDCAKVSYRLPFKTPSDLNFSTVLRLIKIDISTTHTCYTLFHTHHFAISARKEQTLDEAGGEERLQHAVITDNIVK